MKLKLLFLYLTALFAVSCKKEAKTSPVVAQQPATSTLTYQNVQPPQAVISAIKGYIRVQVAADAVNTDDVLISFNSAASLAFVRSEDAPTLNGGGLITLSSLSSDNVPLAINASPLPVKSEKIKLVVNAKADGTYYLNLTKVSTIPSNFEIWLMDNYKKDSLDFRNNPSYAFDMKIADTTSYGSGRFSLVIRQNPGIAMHLLSITAAKAANTAKISWTAENEQTYTSFWVERSTDNGNTYTGFLGQLSTAAGAYNYIDAAPVKGTNMYRIKSSDINGVVSYSSTVSQNF